MKRQVRGYVKILRRSEQPREKVFLVHGHAAEPKQAVAMFLRSVGLEVIILHEQANQGQTIIEKFERHSDVLFAVVLLTPDDFGGPAGHPEKTRLRARQNVILELGYFLAKLGRKNVCCLYVDGVELPSDYDGVLYIPYGDTGWQSQLTKELRAAGIAVDSQSLMGPIALTKRKLLA
jgi:predicted nucleotide-binding protein